MEPPEILERLESTFKKEGLEVELVSSTEKRVEIRARRVAPGIPVAFLVKAIEGTFKRYHPTIQEVLLSEYDPGQDIPVPDQPSPEFEKVLKHQAPSVKRSIPETMGLDLSGLDRGEAIRALENANRVWSAQGIERFLVRGLDQDEPARAFEKWLHFYALTGKNHPDAAGTAQVIHLQDSCAGGDCWTTPIMWMPGRVVLGT